jgi:hypothetical protein
MATTQDNALQPRAGLRPFDASMIEEWAADLGERGWAPPTVARALKRLRAFARMVPGGLFEATALDVPRLVARHG